MKNQRGISGVKRLLGLQFILCTLIAVILLLMFGKKEAISAMLGGVVAMIPAALFASKLFHYQGARAARQILKSFYLGEAIKILSSVILFVLVFKLFKVAPFVFFLTYILILISHWFAPLTFNHKRIGQESD